MLLILSRDSAPSVLPCDTTDSGSLFLFLDCFGPSGAVRAETLEDAFEAVRDFVTPDASALDVLDALDDKDGMRARKARFGARAYRVRRWIPRDGSQERDRPEAWRALRRAVARKDGALPEGYGWRPNGEPTPDDKEKRARLLARFGEGRVYGARLSPIYSEDLNGERLERLTKERMEELRLSIELEPEDIGEGGTVIHGTMCFEDTIPALFEHAHELGIARAILSREDYAHARALYLDGSDDTKAERLESWQARFGPGHAPELLCALIDGLASVCPPGWTFSTHEGDGSDLGFWQTEEEALEERAAPFEWTEVEGGESC